MAIMSLRQYAKHRGVALSAVQKAIQSGRISTVADGGVDSELADGDWERNTTAHAPAVTRRLDQEEDDGPTSGASQYTKARAVREHYQARLAKIDYEERTAKLVSKDEVTVASAWLLTEKHFRRIDGHAHLWALAAILGRETKSTTQPSKEKVA